MAILSCLYQIEVPTEFKDDENFISKVMGEAYLPRMMERTCLEIPVPDDAWKKWILI